MTAQQDKYGWRFGVHGGEMSYYGDLSDKFKFAQPAKRNITPFDKISRKKYAFTAEKSLNSSLGFGLMFSSGSFTATDRKSVSPFLPENENQELRRSLNVLTKLKNCTAYLNYYFDQEELLGSRAILAPYLKAGIGLSSFEVFGDLYSNSGQAHHWSDGTVRDVSEGESIAMAVKLNQGLSTPLPTQGKDFRKVVFTPITGFGLKLRLNSRFNLNFEYMIQFTQTDYLDGISDKYKKDYITDNRIRTLPESDNTRYFFSKRGKDDFYTFATLSAHYNFGKKKILKPMRIDKVSNN
jgi:hypothetical protein